MRRVLMISALLAGVMAFGSMPASAGVSARVDLRFGHPAPVVYASGARGYVPAQPVYVDANNQCGDRGVRYGERVDARWNARDRWSREQGHGQMARHGNQGRWNGRSNGRPGDGRDNNRGDHGRDN